MIRDKAVDQFRVSVRRFMSKPHTHETTQVMSMAITSIHMILEIMIAEDTVGILSTSPPVDSFSCTRCRKVDMY